MVKDDAELERYVDDVRRLIAEELRKGGGSVVIR